MAIAVVGVTFIDIKGFPFDVLSSTGKNAGRVEFVHGGVGRNIAEDIANVELRPMYVSMTERTSIGDEVMAKLKRHKINTDYIVEAPDSIGQWLAVFNEKGDVAAAISKRPDLKPLIRLLKEKGDEIFRNCDSIAVEMDLDSEIVKMVLDYGEKYGKKVYGVVSNMVIASERRDLMRRTDCFVCNSQEAGVFFVRDFSELSGEALADEIEKNISNAGIRAMIVTDGANGSVYASAEGEKGYCPAIPVEVMDTTGAGDAFFAGVAIALTYGKSLGEAAETGTRLASATITSSGNSCPRFQPSELGINI